MASGEDDLDHLRSELRLHLATAAVVWSRLIGDIGGLERIPGSFEQIEYPQFMSRVTSRSDTPVLTVHPLLAFATG